MQQLHDTWQGRPHVITYEFSAGPEDFYLVTFMDGPDGTANGATFIAMLASTEPIPEPNDQE